MALRKYVTKQSSNRGSIKTKKLKYQIKQFFPVIEYVRNISITIIDTRNTYVLKIKEQFKT